MSVIGVHLVSTCMSREKNTRIWTKFYETEMVLSTSLCNRVSQVSFDPGLVILWPSVGLSPNLVIN